MDKLAEFKHGLEETWHSLGEGWRQLRDRASESLTRFTPVNRGRSAQEEGGTLPALASSWGLLAGDLYEDGERIIVRLEVPGMVKDDLDLEVRGDVLVIRGEKRVEQERGDGRYRVRQCTFGSFRRSFTLPAPVIVEKAEARCSNGVLRIELPKEERARGRRIEVRSGGGADAITPPARGAAAGGQWGLCRRSGLPCIPRRRAG